MPTRKPNGTAASSTVVMTAPSQIGGQPSSQRARPAGPGGPTPAGGRRSRGVVLGLGVVLVEADDRLAHREPPPPARYCTSASSCCFGSELKVSGITPFGYPGAT